MQSLPRQVFEFQTKARAGAGSTKLRVKLFNKSTTEMPCLLQGCQKTFKNAKNYYFYNIFIEIHNITFLEKVSRVRTRVIQFLMV